MNWIVKYSERARQDLREIFEYIAFELLAPETAAGQTARIMKEIRSLEEMPMRYRLFDVEPWRAQGLRYFPVNNYLVFYLPNEMEYSVTVVRIMYGGRDIRKQLSDGNEM